MALYRYDHIKKKLYDILKNSDRMTASLIAIGLRNNGITYYTDNHIRKILERLSDNKFIEKKKIGHRCYWLLIK